MKITTKNLILVSMFTALMVVGAYVKVLLPVVPFSLQTFFCAFAGIILGSKLGALSQLIYIALGLAGLPVFTLGGGPQYVLKPTFGFLLGFIAASYVIGKVSESVNNLSFKNALISVMSGLLALNAVGVPYLYFIMRFYLNKPDTTLFTALSIGFFPFIVKDVVLYIIVAAVACTIVPVLKKSGVLSTGT